MQWTEWVLYMDVEAVVIFKQDNSEFNEARVL